MAMGNTTFKNAFEYKVIYIYTIADDLHKGLLKIGDTTVYTNSPIDCLAPNSKELNQAANKRIKSTLTTAGLQGQLLWTELAVFSKNVGKSIQLTAFRDYQVHSVLNNSGIQRKELGNSKEWFELDLETAKAAINAVKKGYSNLSNQKIDKFSPIVFRPEQTACIEKVISHFKKADRFLIDAKMRYGKTFVTLEIIKRLKFKRTLIVTHRPVVDASWYDDFKKIFYNENYIYGSKSNKTNNNDIEELLKGETPFIYFASLQDLRGSMIVGGAFDKNTAFFDTIWDCLVIDEAHEGTTTTLGDDTIKKILKEGKKTKLIELSGTAFNIAQKYDEESSYTWDYIMEQECKSEWDKLHFGDSNPYDELPTLNMYTYSLGDLIKGTNYQDIEDKAFNFKEFFRTFTGDLHEDGVLIPENSSKGDFVHEKDVVAFLNLMTKDDKNSNYPYSRDEYRELFKHSLWMVPGVKEARALKKLMLKHKVFGCGKFDIVNVAGNGDEEESYEEALNKVKKAIQNSGDNYTITLSCGRLTTGVTIREWTAVFMLSGSQSTAASTYLQTIFRVQSPCNINGKIKENAFVFDFAPDRALRMISKAVSISSKAGKSKERDQKILTKFLNYCPVISVTGSEMKPFSAKRLLQELKNAYAEKVVNAGFDDKNLYNDELLKLSEIDIENFDKLKGILGTTKAQSKANDITVNKQGLTDEEYEEKNQLDKKKKKDLTPEEIARLEELNKIKKLRADAISILRGISIRMPLLIFGADIAYDEEISLNKFVDLVDENSWNEFMPPLVTKDVFKYFQKYYDEDVFIAAGAKIRELTKQADKLSPEERIKQIARIFSNFKNPDKETVLTPWRVVNMHLSDTIGGWCFWDEKFENPIEKPRFVNKGNVTSYLFSNEKVRFLEINSKTGLYPLYLAYSCFKEKQKTLCIEKKLESEKKLWNDVVNDNLFIICKTPMAKTITRRTLLGYTQGKINAHCFDDIKNIITYKPIQFHDRVLKESFWGKGSGIMKFDAIVGNPPYQENVGSDSNSSLSKQLFPYFIKSSIELDSNYVSFITPSKWFTAEAQDKSFIQLRKFIKNNHQHFCSIYHYPNDNDVFSKVSIAGGVNYFLYDKNYTGDVQFSECYGINKTTVSRPLFEEDLDIILSMNVFVDILNKVRKHNDFVSMMTITKGRNAFDIVGKETELSKITTEHFFPGAYEVRCAHEKILYTSEENISKNIDIADKWKIFTSKGNGGAGILNNESAVAILGKAYIGKPQSVCTDSLIPIGCFDSEKEAINLQKYMCTKFLRFMVGILKVSQNVSQNVYRFVPLQDFTSNSDINWDVPISVIDSSLYLKYGLSEKEISIIEKMIRPMLL